MCNVYTAAQERERERGYESHSFSLIAIAKKMCKWHSPGEQDKFVHFLNGPRQKEGTKKKNKKIQVYPRLSITNVLLLLDQRARHNFSPFSLFLPLVSARRHTTQHAHLYICAVDCDCVFSALFFFCSSVLRRVSMHLPRGTRRSFLTSAWKVTSCSCLLVFFLLLSLHLTVLVASLQRTLCVCVSSNCTAVVSAMSTGVYLQVSSR